MASSRIREIFWADWQPVMTGAQEVTITTVMEPFATLIRAELDAKGWAISELARRADVPQASASQYVNGKRTPPFDAVVRLARALGVSLDVLAGWRESPAGLSEDEHDLLKTARRLGIDEASRRILWPASPAAPGVQPDRVYVTGGDAQPDSPAQGTTPRRRAR
jgi:transcriptional regulator with XRE-family HTH domain